MLSLRCLRRPRDAEGTVDEFIAGVERFLPQFLVTQHFMGNMLIEVNGELAKAETYAVAYHRKALEDGSGKDDVAGSGSPAASRVRQAAPAAGSTP